jgi:hypothetical protein
MVDDDVPEPERDGTAELRGLRGMRSKFCCILGGGGLARGVVTRLECPPWVGPDPSSVLLPPQHGRRAKIHRTGPSMDCCGVPCSGGGKPAADGG